MRVFDPEKSPLAQCTVPDLTAQKDVYEGARRQAFIHCDQVRRPQLSRPESADGTPPPQHNLKYGRPGCSEVRMQASA